MNRLGKNQKAVLIDLYHKVNTTLVLHNLLNRKELSVINGLIGKNLVCRKVNKVYPVIGLFDVSYQITEQGKQIASRFLWKALVIHHKKHLSV